MNDFQKPIERHERPPVEQPHAVTPIEKDKKHRERSAEDWTNPKAEPFLLANLLASLKKITAIFSFQNGFWGVIDQERLTLDLTAFRDLLLLLCHEDQSHDAEFLQKSSELWHILLEDFNILDIPERKNILFLPKLKIFINQILHFPEREEHSLGFYLTEHVGRDWIPFPFMALLHSLHLEHQDNPAESNLSKWIFSLNEILSDLRHPTP